MKMPTCSLILGCLVALLLSGCGSHYRETSPMMNAGFYLDPLEVMELEQKALKGDTEAANRLALYYRYYENDEEGTLKWHQVGAKFNDPAAYRNLGFFYMTNHKYGDDEKAAYWFKKAIQDGNPAVVKDAKRKLAELQKRD